MITKETCEAIWNTDEDGCCPTCGADASGPYLAELATNIKDLCARVAELEAERDRYLRALAHIRSNAESILTVHDALARIAGEFQETPEFVNARWDYTEANAALTGAGA